uniref:Uncharacterized protein n=1 Tax=Rhinopithecus bieti TaxID=61621 RepID=A0A2K6KEJ4_RHIBE
MASSLNEDPEGSRITYVKGDLFPSCISEDCRRMGAGRDKLLNQREFLERLDVVLIVCNGKMYLR